MTIPEGRAPITDKDLADLTRRLAETAIERNCRCEELEAENERLRLGIGRAMDRLRNSVFQNAEHIQAMNCLLDALETKGKRDE